MDSLPEMEIADPSNDMEIEGDPSSGGRLTGVNPW
jgi:hypothetical protein